MTILQEAAMVVMTPGHHEVVVLHIKAGVVPPIIRAMVVLHIRVGVALHIGAVLHIGAADLVATETVMGTEIVYYRIEILVIMVHQCVQVEVMGYHHILGVVWILHQVITMTGMGPHHHHIAMIEAHHTHTHILPLLLEEVVDIMVVDMVITGAALFLLLHHTITPKGGTETFFANFVVTLLFTLLHV